MTILTEHTPTIALAVLILVHFGHSVWRFGKAAGEQLSLRRDVERVRASVAEMRKGFVSTAMCAKIHAGSAALFERHEREVFHRLERTDGTLDEIKAAKQ